VVEEQEVVRKSRAPVALELAAGPVEAAARTQEVEPTRFLGLAVELAVLAMAAVLGKEQVRDLDLAEAVMALELEAAARKLLALEGARVEVVRTPVVEPTRLLGLAEEPGVLAMAVALDKEPARA
jgi:hypothetical protein